MTCAHPRAGRIFGLSLLMLFVEMYSIRWQGATTLLFAYLANLPLITAFFGIGLGCILGERKGLRWWYFAPLALLQVLVLSHPKFQNLKLAGSINSFWGVYEPMPLLAWTLHFVKISALLLLNALVFLPLGAGLGSALAEGPSLPGYFWNLLGSLAGIWAFALFSAAGTPPHIWLAAAAVVAIALARSHIQRVAIGLALAGAVMLLAGQSMDVRWTPYYRLRIEHYEPIRTSDGAFVPRGGAIFVNQVGFQTFANYSDTAVRLEPRLADGQSFYEWPYRLLRPRRVLILGAGAGNDAAAALRAGVPDITAVEIDPVIVEIGRQRHPERPYDPRKGVRLLVDDARAVLKRPGKYDLVVFGILDSHTALAGMGQIRLDNYLYTVEAIRNASARLAPGGAIWMTFAMGGAWMPGRISALLRAADVGPVFVYRKPGNPHFVYVTGPDLDTPPLPPPGFERIPLPAPSPDVPTDDWPFLHIRERSVPTPYLFCLVGVLALGLGTAALSPLSLRGLVRHPHFFLLGMAFLLLEVRGVTALSLLFSSTWWVNVAVFSGILGVNLFATWLLLRRIRVPRSVVAGGLFVGLAAVGLVPFDSLFRFGVLPGRMLGTLLYAIPFFFAALLFADFFERSRTPNEALGANLVGALFGGILEYATMRFGLRALVPLAFVLYAAALFLGARRRGRATAS